MRETATPRLRAPVRIATRALPCTPQTHPREHLLCSSVMRSVLTAETRLERRAQSWVLLTAT
jgi:hypothetical protein